MLGSRYEFRTNYNYDIVKMNMLDCYGTRSRVLREHKM